MRTLTEALDEATHRAGDHIAYRFLRDGETETGSLTFGHLRDRALGVAARLTSRGACGDRAILVYPQGLEFLVAFFGCLYAGVIAVPTHVPGRKSRLDVLRRIAVDAEAKWLLSTGSLLEQLALEIADDPVLGPLPSLDTEAALEGPGSPPPPAIRPEGLALLQYTSGSTGSPRGVAVTHANLAANQRQIELCFDDDESRLVSWLPMFHDMGLGTVLQAVWAGGSCTLMSPQAFLQGPRRWLQAISKYRATVSGAPDFAFELCARRVHHEDRVGLDLRTWRVAYNGSEPVRAATIERFARAFSSYGFRRDAFHPVYGLAEATVLATSEPPSEPPLIWSFSTEALEHGRGVRSAPSSGRRQALVSCGRPWLGTRMTVVNPDTGEECAAGEIGEIWISGDSVAVGYWRRDAETEATFGAMTAAGDGPFLRTGDLGFIDEGHLFVTGRHKDLIIIHGRNHYPQDIEASVSSCHPALAPHGCAAFSIDGAEGERLIVVQEVNRSALRGLNAAEVIRAIRKTVSLEHAVHTHAVVLIKPSTLPRTSSGKVQHKACRRAFLEKSLDEIGSWMANALAGVPTAGPTAREANQRPERADDLIEWLRRNAADAMSDCVRDERNGIPLSLFRTFGRQGLLGMQVAEEYGGMGLGHFDCARVLEQVAAIDFTLSLLVGLNNYLGIQPIARHAGPAVKALLLPGLAQGDDVAAFALIEPLSGPSATTLSTRADADDPDQFRLFGTKYLHCVARGASVMNVFARHEEPAGVSAFVVTEASDGLRQIRDGLSLGVLGLTQDAIVLDGVRVGRENLLGDLGGGMEIVRESVLHARLAIGAACIGGMKRCAQFVARHGPYSGNFDGKRTPNPVTLSRLGSVTARVTALECLVRRTARAIDAGRDVPPEAFAACRILGPELLLRSVDDLMQLGMSGGPAESHRLACLYRDVGLLRNFDGPPEAVAEVTGGRVMEGDAALRELLEEVFGAPGIVRWIDLVVDAVRQRMKTLHGALARRPQRWGDTRAGELSAWLALLAAVDGARSETPSAEIDRARAWAHAQFEHALSCVRFGTPSEMATVDASDVAATFAAYARTIGDLDEAAAAPSSPVSPSDELRGWIVSWVAHRLRVPISEVDVARSFADHGLDSIAAVELSVELSEKLGCRLDETLLWNFSTIAALVQWSADRRPHVAAHFEADAVLDRGVLRPSASMPSFEPSSVLLTGATGFLGAFLLFEILSQTRAQVTCLVRAADSVSGAARVVKNLAHYGLWNDAFMPRLIALAGNLAEPRLGLDGATFARLAEDVDAIYNNGARLSFVAGYEDLKPSHVYATREILRLASRGRAKVVHHVSSVAVYDAVAYRGRIIAESTAPVESQGIHLPYAQCKWVSETLASIAQTRGIPVTIHRPALIAGSSLSGAWNTADFLCRMLKAVIDLGCMPGDLDLELDFSPVDYVSRSIVDLSRRPSSLGRAFHLQNPRSIHLETFGSILRSFGYDIGTVRYWDWVARIEARREGPLYPLLPFLGQRWRPDDLSYVELAQHAHRPRLQCAETVLALAPGGIECPALDAALIGRYLSYLTATGFVARPPRPSVLPDFAGA
jgi:thioester reductase-like protein